MLDLATLGSAPWGDIGIVGIATILTVTCLRLILGGRFVPREQVDLMLEDARKRAEFAESASATKDATIATQAQQIARLTVSSELSVHLLESITSRSGHVAQTD